MSSTPSFDASTAHRWFAPRLFNRVWELLELPQRSPEQIEEMLLACQASLWHWTQREDCTDKHRSTGYWQLSRVLAVLGRAEEAARAGRSSQEYARSLGAFHRAYAEEALARAALLGGDHARSREHLARARALLGEVGDPEERSLLEKDLATIQ